MKAALGLSASDGKMATHVCPCGYYNDPTRHCKCTPPQIQRYISKISGPLLDRIDIHIDVPAVRVSDLSAQEAHEGSAEIRRRVHEARKIQHQRFHDEPVYSNAQMSPRLIRRFCALAPPAQALLERAITRYGLSARAYDRILKVSRTIADLNQSEHITEVHISEAVNYRTLDRNFWQ